ncbi:hypothetical protein DRJ17_02345 [Candidatus Woesearchaeota archaeon]|nr:MAG: hypothetical protein DRJ17_02345 [Candidatus Woesearchaeota archaeon]
MIKSKNKLDLNENFIKKFINEAKRIYESGEKLVWPIPKGANKYKGEYGLLPEDENIKSWQVPPTTAMLLRFLILAKKARTVLELGASVGYSTIWLGLAAKETGGHVYTTEIFKPKAEIARKNFEKAGVSDVITLYEECILTVLEKWPKNKKIDFVFMDADKQNYHKYLKLMYALLSEGAMVVVDNVGDYPEHMENFIEYCKKIKDAATYMLDIDHGLFLLIKKEGTNIMPLVAEYYPIFRTTTLKVLIKTEELLDFWKKYIKKKAHLRSDILLIPIMLNLMDNVNYKTILVMEWGPGRIAHDLLKMGVKVTKIDLQRQEKLFKNLKRSENIEYFSSNIFKINSFSFDRKFDIVFSYMFHPYLSKREFVNSLRLIKKCLNKDGVFIYADIQPFRAIVKSKLERGVISLHNPFYAHYPNFTSLKAKLRISDGSSLLSEYNRYPLSFLLNNFAEIGFEIQKVYEPIPNLSQIRKYPILFSEEDRRIPPYIILLLKRAT